MPWDLHRGDPAQHDEVLANIRAFLRRSRGSQTEWGAPAEEHGRAISAPLLPRAWREGPGVVQVKIAAAIEVNQATIARFEDGTAWPRRHEEVLMAYASELDMDVRLLWLHAFVLWLEHEPVLDTEREEQIRAALKRLQIYRPATA
jgi:hypothetical protein